MNQKVELYIENVLVDLDSDTDIRLTKQYNDIFDPAKLLVDFTKTVSLPNTPRNNGALGHIWSPSRQVLAGPNITTSFNPSKRASFKLFVGDSLIHEGYAKMLDVKWTGPNKWRYEVGLFGVLGGFLQSFGDSTLRETLEASTPYASKMLLRGVTMNRLWRARESSINNRDGMFSTTMYTIPNYTTRRQEWTFDCSYRNLYIDLIDSENGMYTYSDQVVYDDSYNADGRYTKLPQQYSEHQFNMKKPYKQRFGFYTDMLLGTLLNKYGYTLDTTTDWTKMANPYWSQMMVTSLVPADKTSNPLEYAQAFQGTIKDPSFYDPGSKKMYHGLFFDVSTLTSNNPDGFSIVNSSDGFYVNFWGVTNYRTLQINKSNVENNFYTVKFDLTDPDLDLMKLVFTNSTNETYYLPLTNEYTEANPFMDITLWGRVKRRGSLFYQYDAKKVARFRLVSYSQANNSINVNNSRDNYWAYFPQFPYSTNQHNILIDLWDGASSRPAYLTEILKQKAQQFFIDTFNYGVNDDVEVSFCAIITKNHNSANYIQTSGGVRKIYNNVVTLKTNINEWRYTITSDNTVRSGASIPYSDILPNITAKDFFTSYMKQFGLLLGVDGSTVSLYTRNEYFRDYSIQDWTLKFDMSKDWSLVPLNFNTEWISLSYAENEDELTKGYKTKYNKTYGSQYLNTGYEFNRSEYKLLDGNVFCTYSLGDMTTDIFGYKGQTLKLPQLYKGEFSKSSPADKPSLVFSNGYLNDVASKRNISNFYWVWADDASVDNQGYNLSYFRPFTSSEGYYSLIQTKEPSYFGPNVSDGRVALQTTPYYPSPSQMTYSLDFGVPQEQYFGNVYDPSSTIYSRLWANYLRDRYNVNTKVFKGYFYLTAAELASWKWSTIVWFKDCYWAVNKIVDYRPGMSEPTQVELVSINNLSSYVDGQYIPFEDTINPKEPSTYSMLMTPTSVQFAYTGEPSGNIGKLDVSADAWVTWSLNSQPWVKMNPSTGKGSIQVDLSIGVNNSFSLRDASIVLSSPDVSSRSTNLRQLGNPALLTYDISLYSTAFFPPDNYSIWSNYDPQVFTVNVSTNSWNAWKASRDPSSTTWIRFNGTKTSTEWTTGSGSFTINIMSNPNVIERFGSVRVDSSAGALFISIEQEGNILE